MIPLTYSESLQNSGYGHLSYLISTKTHIIGVAITRKPYDMTLRFDVGCFLHRPKLQPEYHQNLKESALLCVDLTWNDPSATLLPKQPYIIWYCASLDIDLPTWLPVCFSLSPSILIFVCVLCCVASTLIRASTSLFLLYPHGSAHTLTS